MMQPIEGHHLTDEAGNPAGGTTKGLGLEINWQNGPLGRENRKDANGAFVETVIAAALERLGFYQNGMQGKFKCRENALAITKLEEALHWLDHRSKERERRGVEGTHDA